jgi:dihydrofolate reductase
MINPKIVIISAMTKDRVIGCNNTIPWTAKSDMRNFASTTKNNIVVMGRKTFESLGSKPLKNRYNVVITSSVKDIIRDDSDTWFVNNIELALHHITLRVNDAYNLAVSKNDEVGANFWKEECKVFIIGGNRLYSYGAEIADEMILTELDVLQLPGDTYFPVLQENAWQKEVIGSFEQNADNEYSGTIYRYTRLPEKERGKLISIERRLDAGFTFTRRAWRDTDRYVFRIPFPNSSTKVKTYGTPKLSKEQIDHYIEESIRQGHAGRLAMIHGGILINCFTPSAQDRDTADWICTSQYLAD